MCLTKKEIVWNDKIKVTGGERMKNNELKRPITPREKLDDVLLELRVCINEIERRSHGEKEKNEKEKK